MPAARATDTAAQRGLQPISFANPWIAAVDQARHPAPAWAVLPAGVLAAAAAGLIARLAGEALGGAAGGGLAGLAVFTLVVFAPLVAAAVIGASLEGRRLLPAEPQPLASLAAGAGLGGVGYGLAAAIAAAAGVVAQGTGPQGLPALGGAVAGLALVAYQAGAEELLFRGWMQPVLCARLGPLAGLALTSAIFAGLHLAGAPRSLLAVVNITLGGLLFGLLALRTGGLWAAIGAHVAWNWTEQYALGLDPNPGVGPTGALLDLDLSGPALWSGGADGMNGSLAATGVLALLVGGLLLARPRPTG